MKPKNVLLIGGNGFLGSHAAAAFLPVSQSVSVLDRPGSARGSRLGVPLDLSQLVQYEGSVADVAVVREVIEATQAEIIVVFSSYGEQGLGLMKSAERNPAGAVEVNIVGLLNVLEAASEQPGCQVLWMSSTTVYGGAEAYNGRKVTEDDLVAPQSTYAASKVFGEQLIRTYRATKSVNAVAIRPTLIWGPGITYSGVQSGLNEMVEGAAQNRTVSVAVGDEPWDLLYVKDAAAALVQISRNKCESSTLNLNGYTASLNDVRQSVISVSSQTEIETIAGAPRLGFPLVDDSRVRRLGFAPSFDLEGSIRDYLSVVTQQNEVLNDSH